MKKQLPILLFLLLFTSSLCAQKKLMGVYVNDDVLQFIYTNKGGTLIKTVFSTDSASIGNEDTENATYWKTIKNANFIHADSLGYNINCSKVLLNKQFTTPHKKGAEYKDYVFFAPHRYAIVDRDIESQGFGYHYKTRSSTYLWKVIKEGDMRFAVLFGSPTPYDGPSIIGYAIPLRDGSFYLIEQKVKPQPNTYPKRELFSFFGSKYDIQLFKKNRKQGLKTGFGQTIIPAVYDSLTLASFAVVAYKGKRVQLLDYMGKIFRDNLKFVASVKVSLQVIDEKNQMYFINQDFVKSQKPTQLIYMVCGTRCTDIDYHITKSKSTGKQYVCETSNEYSDYIMRHNPMVKGKDSTQMMEQICLSNYGFDMRTQDGYEDIGGQYNKNITYVSNTWQIPSDYKNLHFTNNTQFKYSEDKYSKWIIAQYKGKWGMIDFEDPQHAIIPFQMDSIVTNRFDEFFLLEKNGLKTYYPVSLTPKYKTLSKFNVELARYELPSGQKGWIDRTGKEYPDPKTK